jgi:hypothetical protein
MKKRGSFDSINTKCDNDDFIKCLSLVLNNYLNSKDEDKDKLNKYSEAY